MNTQSEREARAVWSVLAEPTDATARLLWNHIGIVEALEVARTGDVAHVARLVGAAANSDGAQELPVVAAQASAARAAHGDPTALARAALKRWQSRLSAGAFAIVEHSKQWGVRHLVPGDDEWPAGLDDLRINAPVCMWARGSGFVGSPVLPARTLALVGSRAATSYGIDVATDIAATVAQRGGVVVSGGAFGIDAAAHRGALTTGATAAVLAGGLDDFYPRGNAELLTDVANRGVVMSEAPLGVRPTRWRFLARNRLIAAIAGATVVVEAAWRSGALSTAAHADSLSRLVGAVPGSVHSAASGGCHRLVRERGAMLVTGADDALELVADFAHMQSESAVPPGLFDDAELLSAAERLVYDGIPPHSSITVEGLARECAVSIHDVHRALTRVELLGLADVENRVVRRRRKA